MSVPLSHLDEQGRARMVDVSDKPSTLRTAEASGRVRMAPATLEAIYAGKAPKGDVLATARLAGIQAAKRTSELIPLCHPLGLDHCELDFARGEGHIAIRAVCRLTARTGVEMEALTAVAVAALTIYDMAKAIDRAMVIEAIQLEAKEGGRSGSFRR